MDITDCAGQLLSTIPLVMRTIKIRMRGNRPANLSVPQFRVLAYLRRHEGASLSDAAEHVGLTLPTVSRLVDGLVKHGSVERETSSEDRRRVTLKLSRDGRSLLDAANRETRARLAEMLETLPEEKQAEIARAMESLRQVFSPHPESPG